MNHAQRLATFVGTVVYALGLITGEGLAQADFVDPGTGRMKALITYKAEGLSGLLFAVANLDQTGWAIAE